jgi:hypothetical protein
MKNFIRNGDFLEWPLGTSFAIVPGTPTTAISGDLSFVKTGSPVPDITVSRQQHAVLSSIRQGFPKYYLRVAPSFAVGLGAADKSYLTYNFAATLDRQVAQGAYGHFSFWARSSVNREIVIRFVRNFGTGGSNSNGHTTEILVTKSVQLTTGWKKYQVDCRFPAFVATYGSDASVEARIYLQGGSAELGDQQLPSWPNATVDFSQVALTLTQVAEDYTTDRLSLASPALERVPLYVDVSDFGGVGDGTASDTAAVLRAYNALSPILGGEIRFGPGVWKYNLVIAKNNVTITGQCHYRDGFAADINMRNRHIPDDITKPVIQVGDDLSFYRGIIIRECNFYGASTGLTGLYFAGGAFECSVQNCVVTFFTTCIKVQGGTAFPASIIRFSNVDGQPSNLTGARGWYISNTANYPTSWTTEINLHNCHWDGPASAANSYVMEVESCEIKLTNSYFDVSDGHGVKISHNLTPVPWIDAINSNVDSGASTRVAIEGYNNLRIFAGLASINFQINGKYKELDGTLMQPPPCHLRQNTLLVYPAIYGALSFTNAVDPAWLGGTYSKFQIYAGTNALYIDTTTGIGQIHCYLGNGLFEIHNKNPTPDGNTYVRFTDDLNVKHADIHSLNGFLDTRPNAGSATRLQSSDGLVTGIQVNGTGASVFFLGTNIVANQNLYVDNNRQLQSGVMVDFVQTAAGTVANTVAETTVIGTVSGPGKTLIANRFTVGKNFKGRFRGRYSTTGTPTLQLKVKLGSTVILDTGAIVLGSGVTNKYFELEFDVTCRTTGVTGTVFAEGKAIFDTVVVPIVNTAAATIDTTIPQVVDVTATWGTASASNIVTGATGVFNEGFSWIKPLSESSKMTQRFVKKSRRSPQGMSSLVGTPSITTLAISTTPTTS